MKWCKRIIGWILAGVFVLSLCGCQGGEQWKDHVISGFDHLIQSFGHQALTKDCDLQGERSQGEDSYTGTYEADYRNFNGEEYLFGGTALERDRGNQLKITYTLKITEGSGAIYWLEKGEKHVIADTSIDGVFDLTLSAGDNYIVIEGDRLNGHIKMAIEG